MRTITREKVMKLLYMMDIHRQVLEEIDLKEFLDTPVGMDVMIQQKNYMINDRDDVVYFDETFQGVVDNLVGIDGKIQEYTKQGWIISQFGFIERAILRLAVYEIYWSMQEGINTKIIVSSAIDFANNFADEKSVKFIHGILGAMTNNAEKIVAPAAKKNKHYTKQSKESQRKNLDALKKFNNAKRSAKREEEALLLEATKAAEAALITEQPEQSEEATIIAVTTEVSE